MSSEIVMTMIKQAKQPFHLMIKPTGASCNLACTYCYYLEKAKLYPESACRMDDDTLERITAAYLQVHPANEVIFGWQGGEPLMMGLDFFRRALALQTQYARPGQHVQNALQTNATLVTDEWAQFFAEHNFLVGVSLDGPANLHNHYRRDRGGQDTHHRVVSGLQTLLRHGVEVNALVTVNRENMRQPLEVYRHLTELGIQHLQFIPIVERESMTSRKVTPWSVRPEPFGEFLCTVFDYWARHDVGKVFLQLVESTLNVWLGGPPTMCVFGPTCGRALVAEHNGDLYACDHFVYRDYRRGPITPETLAALVDSPEQNAFGQAKAQLATECQACPVRRFCGGDCPKHRIRSSEDGKPISYLCPAYRQFFTHSAEILQAMANEIRAGRPATNVMEVLQMIE
ncbi:MAG TPA: anaerobic sulfatase maturase [Armatimonadota bacterium]|nr:anaerobic sulfatase maturase [Armatimonadota bacterium]